MDDAKDEDGMITFTPDDRLMGHIAEFAVANYVGKGECVIHYPCARGWPLPFGAVTSPAINGIALAHLRQGCEDS